MSASISIYDTAVKVIDELQETSAQDLQRIYYLNSLRRFVLAEQRTFSQHETSLDAQGIEEEMRKLKNAILTQRVIQPKG